MKPSEHLTAAKQLLIEKERFWKQVNRTDGCWPWTGYIAPDKWARGKFRLANGKMILATHYSWKLAGKGEVPHGLCLCHHCDNPPCVNPDHLFMGTRLDNAADMKAKGRSRQGPSHSGETSPQAKLNWAKVRDIRERYKTKDISTYRLADIYGVSQRAVFNIIQGKSWKHDPLMIFDLAIRQAEKDEAANE